MHENNIVSSVLFYFRLFGTKCEKCHHSFGKTDFVMRAKNKIFHLECFRCMACHKQLIPGEEFALQNDGTLFCKEDSTGRHFITGYKTDDKEQICGSKSFHKSEENNNRSSALKRDPLHDNDEDEDGLGNNLKEEDGIDPDDEMMSIKSEDDFVVKNEKEDSSSFSKLYEGKNSKLIRFWVE